MRTTFSDQQPYTEANMKHISYLIKDKVLVSVWNPMDLHLERRLGTAIKWGKVRLRAVVQNLTNAIEEAVKESASCGN